MTTLHVFRRLDVVTLTNTLCSEECDHHKWYITHNDEGWAIGNAECTLYRKPLILEQGGGYRRCQECIAEARPAKSGERK